MIDKESLPFTLADSLSRKRIETPDKVAIIFLDEMLNKKHVFTYEDLHAQAVIVANKLRSLVNIGDRVALMMHSGPEFVAALYGCIYAGAIAVPVLPAKKTNSSRRSKLLNIIKDSAAGLVVATENSRLNGEIKWISGTKLLEISIECLNCSESIENTKVTPSNVAILQYTSGSTGNPKGVMLSHDNILANIDYMNNRLGYNDEMVGCSWLPFQHDMGLIGSLLQLMVAGATLVYMSPQSFARNPLSWIKVISDYKVSHSVAPDFAYELCANRLKESQSLDLKLDCWDVAVVGSERVKQSTIENFYSQFKQFGFRMESFFPCYGLAEATLMVTGARYNVNANENRLSSINSNMADNISYYNNGDQGNSDIVSSGIVSESGDVLVIDVDAFTVQPEKQIGEIWVSNNSVAQGYWKNPKLSKEVFKAELLDKYFGRKYLRTGDLGYISNDNLYVIGRIKDLIIIRGINYVPQDIEATVQSCDEHLVNGSGVAFSLEFQGEERLVLVQEVISKINIENVTDGLISKINAKVISVHGIEPIEILLIRKNTLKKTTSGKIQRYVVKKEYLEQVLTVVARKKYHGVRNSGFLEGDIKGFLLEKWSQILGKPISEICLDEDFFEIGGDSLKVNQLLAEVQERFNIEIPLQEIFESPTIKTLIELAQTEYKLSNQSSDARELQDVE